MKLFRKNKIDRMISNIDYNNSNLDKLYNNFINDFKLNYINMNYEDIKKLSFNIERTLMLEDYFWPTYRNYTGNVLENLKKIYLEKLNWNIDEIKSYLIKTFECKLVDDFIELKCVYKDWIMENKINTEYIESDLLITSNNYIERCKDYIILDIIKHKKKLTTNEKQV